MYRSSWLVLTRLAYLLVGDRNEAEDIVQNVFTTAVARWDSIDDPGVYLRRAVVNRANDAHRQSYRHARAPLDTERAAGELEVDELWGVLARLPRSQRTVVVLRFYEDLTLADIAIVLGRPASTVRSDLRRALTKLKEVLR